MSLYHMYVAAFGPPEAVIFRGMHLLFTLTLVFILYPFRRKAAQPGESSIWRFLAGGWGFVLHIFLNYSYFINRIIYIDDLSSGTSLRGGGGDRRARGDPRVIGLALR